jgi:hypothetical protein
MATYVFLALIGVVLMVLLLAAVAVLSLILHKKWDEWCFSIIYFALTRGGVFVALPVGAVLTIYTAFNPAAADAKIATVCGGMLVLWAVIGNFIYRSERR